MFSPSIKSYNQPQENADSTTRKPGFIDNQLPRKAFSDRSVNENTVGNKPLKLKPPVSESIVVPEKKSQEEFFTAMLDTCSYKDVEDTYEDIIPTANRLTREKIYQLVNTIKLETPPAKFNLEIDKMFLDVLKDDFFAPSPRETFKFEEIEDVFMPSFDFNDFAI